MFGFVFRLECNVEVLWKGGAGNSWHRVALINQTIGCSMVMTNLLEQVPRETKWGLKTMTTGAVGGCLF